MRLVDDGGTGARPNDQALCHRREVRLNFDPIANSCQEHCCVTALSPTAGRRKFGSSSFLKYPSTKREGFNLATTPTTEHSTTRLPKTAVVESEQI